MKFFPARPSAALVGALALTLIAVPTWAQEAPTPTEQALTALHLLEGARYGEAIPAAQALVDAAPNDPLAYQIRGTLSLYVGDAPAAQRDFATAAGLNPGNPVTIFGHALGFLARPQWQQAEGEFEQVRQRPALTPQQAADTDTALAYVRFLKGDLDGVRTLAQSGDATPDPARQELLALTSARTQPAAGAAQLTAFLQTPSGAPRVREDEGLRPLFETAPAPVVAAVTEPSLQQMFQASLRDGEARAAHRGAGAAHVGGDVTLRAPDGLGPRVAMVTFTIDGQVAGMANTQPYEYPWHTAGVSNGLHSIKIEASDSSGQVISTVTRQIEVVNAGPTAARWGLAGDAGLETRVWNLLRLRPARKVAEWTLANLDAQAGDAAGAQFHRTVAAALDTDYKDARRAAHALFGGANVRLAKAGLADGLWQEKTSRKVVALTFDDGPNPQKTPALLDALDKANAPATFFVVGSRAEAAPDLVRRMAARGDDVEDHSYTHPNMAQTAPAIAESEILRTSVIIRALSGRRPRFFRPPGGQRNPVVYRLAAEYGQTVALWTIDALNYEEAGSPQVITDFVLKHLQPGAIVLMHNGMDGTTAAVPGLVSALRARGYQLVTLSQLTGAGGAIKAAAVPK